MERVSYEINRWPWGFRTGVVYALTWCYLLVSNFSLEYLGETLLLLPLGAFLLFCPWYFHPKVFYGTCSWCVPLAVFFNVFAYFANDFEWDRDLDQFLFGITCLVGLYIWISIGNKLDDDEYQPSRKADE